MANMTGYSVVEGIAILRIANPPANALSQPVRASLSHAVTRAIEDAEVTGLVLAGNPGSFASGEDLSDLEKPSEVISLRALCDQIETCPKPVVAALEGTVYGGGFDLALAAHYRVAVPSARVSLPEARIGLIPSGGATQRLPRIVSAEVALNLLLTGRVLRADAPQLAPLFDEMPPKNALRAAAAFCKTLEHPRPSRTRTDGFADPFANADAVSAARSSISPERAPEQARIVELVEAAALLPFDAGLAMEEDAYQDLVATSRSRALRHVLLAERAAWRFDLPNTTKLPDVSRIAVLGGGPMAMQMVLAALNAGLKVNWGTRDPARLVEGLDQVRQVFVAGVKEGGLTQEAAKARLAQLTTGDSADMVKGADIILHAARGQGDVPAPPDAIRAVAMPGKVEEFGLRFAPPILSSRLVEVVEGPSARPEQIAAGVVLVQRMNKVPVQVRSGGQSAVARLFTALNRAADALIDSGADPYDIDGAMRDSGWSQPVFQHRDTVGLQEVARGVRAEGAVNWSGKLVDVGRMGVPEGLGFYIWKDGQAQPDIEVTDLVDEVRPRKNLKPSEIMRLLVGALANEGARMLDEGMVQRASDIDVLAVMGLDMPRDSGGPMMAVSQMGMFAVKTAIERFDHPDKAFWTPHPSWAELIKNGRAFMAR